MLLLLTLMVSKKLLANGLSIFFFNSKPVFSNGPKGLSRNPPDSIILDRRVFDSFILVEKLFAKALQRLAMCLLVNNSLCEKLASFLELPLMFDDSQKFIK